MHTFDVDSATKMCEQFPNQCAYTTPDGFASIVEGRFIRAFVTERACSGLKLITIRDNSQLLKQGGQNARFAVSLVGRSDEDWAVYTLMRLDVESSLQNAGDSTTSARDVCNIICGKAGGGTVQ